jgi:hypothetical protein
MKEKVCCKPTERKFHRLEKAIAVLTVISFLILVVVWILSLVLKVKKGNDKIKSVFLGAKIQNPSGQVHSSGEEFSLGGKKKVPKEWQGVEI